MILWHPINVLKSTSQYRTVSDLYIWDITLWFYIGWKEKKYIYFGKGIKNRITGKWFKMIKTNLHMNCHKNNAFLRATRYNW